MSESAPTPAALERLILRRYYDYDTMLEKNELRVDS